MRLLFKDGVFNALRADNVQVWIPRMDMVVEAKSQGNKDYSNHAYQTTHSTQTTSSGQGWGRVPIDIMDTRVDKRKMQVGASTCGRSRHYRRSSTHKHIGVIDFDFLGGSIL